MRKAFQQEGGPCVGVLFCLEGGKFPETLQQKSTRSDMMDIMIKLCYTGVNNGLTYCYRYGGWQNEELRRNPVTDMRGFGTYNLPAGSWSDDSSMALATLHSLQNGYDLEDMMDKFALWMNQGEYTPPFGELFDIGITCRMAISNYLDHGDVTRCGGLWRA